MTPFCWFLVGYIAGAVSLLALDRWAGRAARRRVARERQS